MLDTNAVRRGLGTDPGHGSVARQHFYATASSRRSRNSRRLLTVSRRVSILREKGSPVRWTRLAFPRILMFAAILLVCWRSATFGQTTDRKIGDAEKKAVAAIEKAGGCMAHDTGRVNCAVLFLSNTDIAAVMPQLKHLKDLEFLGFKYAANVT